MTTAWMLRTDHDPLAAVRQLLAYLWIQAGLEGMLVPYYQTEAGDLMPYLVEDRKQLAAADPFVPLTVTNSAIYALQLARERPNVPLGAVLRSCEARALQYMTGRAGIDLDGWLIVGVDCLASYSAEDFGWRLQRAGESDLLTHAHLRFARQGGIAPYRYRLACQMCGDPIVAEADLSIHLIGLPVKEFVLVTARNEAVSARLHLEEVAAGPAPEDLVAQHTRTLASLNSRRMHFRERLIQGLPDSLPGEVNELIAFLSSCAPCQRCLAACPIYAGEMAGGTAADRNGARSVRVSRWMAACITCGMCEEVCPKQLPLVAVIERVKAGLMG